MLNTYNLYNLEAPFRKYLSAGNQKTVSTKNYLSDIRHFFGWITQYLKSQVSISKNLNEFQLISIVDEKMIFEYKSYLESNGIPNKTINRRLSTLRKFCSFCISQGWMKENPAKKISNIKVKKAAEDKQISTNKALKSPILRYHGISELLRKWKIGHQLPNTLPNLLSISDFGLQHYIGLIIILIFVSVMGAGIYNQFFVKNRQSFAYPTGPTFPGVTAGTVRMLSFQGRLTDSLSNPITTATNVVFQLYSVSSGGVALYTTGTCSVTPDQDGIFSSLIGSTCGSGISASIFSENANIYLGVTAGADAEMTPRQQIANVGYAINSETLQGLPPGSGTSNIPYINVDGNLLIAATSPGIRSTYVSTDFTLSSAKAAVIQSAGTGDIVLQATESGTLKFRTGGSTDTENRLTIDGSGNTTVTNQGDLRLAEPSGAGTNYVGLQAPDTLAGDTVYKLPNAFPGAASGYYLTSNTTGDMSWSNSISASSLKWNALTDPDGDMTLTMGTNNSTFNWDPGADTTETNFSLTAQGEDTTGTGDQDQILFSLAQATNGASDVDEGLDALLTLTNNDGNDMVQNAIRFDTGGAGTDFTYGINFDAADIGTAELKLENAEQIHNQTDGTITLEDGSGTDYATFSSTTLTALGDLVVQGTTGLTFNTGAGGDITFANAEKIDNDTNGTIAVTGDLDASGTLKAGTADAFSVDASGNTTIDNQGDVRLSEPDGAGTNYVGLQAPDTLAGDTVYKLPNAFPGAASGYYLTSNTTGDMSWSNSISASSLKWNALTDPDGVLTLAMGANTTTWNWDSLTTGTGLTAASTSLSSGNLASLSVNSTAAASNTQKVLNIGTAGANGTSTQTTYGLYSTNTHTGTASTNVAGYFSASGGTNNYGLIVENGNVGIGDTDPTFKLRVHSGTTDSITSFYSSDDTGRIRIEDNDTPVYVVAKDSYMSLGGDNTLSAANLNIANTTGYVGIGDTSPDAKLEVLGTTEQLRLTYTDDTVDSRFTVSSTGDLTIDAVGGGTIEQVILADADVLNIGGSGSTDVAYNVIGDSTAGATSVDSDDDLYIEGNLEVDGTIYGTFSGTVPWNEIDNPAADLTLTMAAYNSTFNWDPGADAAETNFSLTTQGEDLVAGGEVDQVLLALSQTSNGSDVDQAADSLLTLTNNDANDPITNGLRFDAGAAGTDFTYGINFDAASIGTAELILQNAETIDNVTDGVIAITAPTGTGISSYLQVGSATPTTYSRFGTNTTGWSLSGASDLLISGDLEIDSQLYVDGTSSNYFAGTVGINDLTPDAKLDIDSTLTTGGDFLITNTGIGTSGTIAGITANSVTTGDILTLSATALTTGSQLVITGPSGGTAGVTDAGLKLTSDVGNIGTSNGLISSTATFDGTTATGVNLYLSSVDAVVAGNTDYGIYNTVSNTGAITTQTKNVYGSYTSVTGTGGTTTTPTTNVYGGYITTTASHATDVGTVNQYGMYIANGTSSTNGTSTKYGLYVESPTGADSNYAAIFAGGNVGIGDTSPSATLTVGDTDLFQVAGATGNITTAGDLAVNGDNITADGTLGILGATGLTLQATTGTVTLDSIAASQIINVGASNVARTLNLGTGTGIDTINIGTGATGVDVVTIGNVGTLSLNSNDWDISTTGAMTGITGITNDGVYTQTGTSANTFTGTATFSNATYSALFTGGNVGIGTTGPDAKLDVLSTTEQLRLTYTDGSVYTSLTTNSAGDLSLNTTGNDVTISDSLIVTNPNTSGSLILLQSAAGTTQTAGTNLLNVSGTNFETDGTNLVRGIIITAAGESAGVGSAQTAIYLNGAAWDTDIRFSNGSTITTAAGFFDIDGDTLEFDILTTGDTTIGMCKDVADGTADVEPRECSGAPSDIAEFYAAEANLRPGDIVAIKTHNNKPTLSKTSTPYQSDVFGIISTYPVGQFGKPLGTGTIAPDEYPTAIGLTGKVPTKISTEGGTIKVGDPLVPSSFPGVAMKATKPGKIIGYALEPFDGSTKISTEVRKQEEYREQSITKFNLDPEDPPEPSVGKILVFINSGWHDPDVYLTDAGDLEIKNDSQTPYVYDGNPNVQNQRLKIKDQNYTLKIKDEIVQRIGAFSELVAGKIKSGLIETENILVDNILIAKNLIVQEKIVSPIVETEKIITNEIKPQNDDLTIDLGENTSPLQGNNDPGALARLIIKGLEGKSAVVIDSAGNASFSGQIIADSLIINNDATVSGNLASETLTTNEASISGKLIAGEIESGTIDSLSSNINDVQKLIADIKNQPVPNLTNETNLTNVSNFDSITVTGNSNLYSVSVSNSLLVGTTLIDQNSIISLSSELKLSALSTINLLDGAVIIAKDGTITTKGELIAEGGIRTDTIKPLTNDGQVKISNLAIDNLTINNISTNSAVIAAPDNFAQNGIFAPAIETATASAGIGTLPENSSEVVIYNNNIKEDSLIYLTPTSDLPLTNQLTVGEKSIGAKPFFKVITNPQSTIPIKFNWLIVN